METRTFYLSLTLLGFMAFLAGCSAQVKIFADCPKYVSEGENLVCSCVYAAPTSPPDLAISWPGHSTNDQIKKDKVDRAVNGTDFMCEVTANNVTTRVVYTLQVAYGPADVFINGTRPIITNGIDPVTLTCSATVVNPTPSFTWTGINCSNGNQGKDTCTFTPAHVDEGKVVTCTARNSLVRPNGQTASGNFTLSVNYPPTDPPEITGFEQGQPLSTGDKLNCTVKGGNPVVALVVFSCVDPQLHDETDEIGTDSVISSLTVNTSLASSSVMLCVCVATWNPEPGLYNQSNVVANVTVEYTLPSSTTATTPAPVTTTTTTTITTTTTTPAPTTTAANPNPVSTSDKTPTANPNPVSTSDKTPTATPTQPTSVITTLPSSPQTASPDTSATTQKQTVPDGSTSGGASTNPDSPSTAASGITPGGGTGDTTTPMAQPQTDGATFPMAILGGCLGALFLLILIIIIIVYCRKRQERDVRLVNRAESADGSYKHASDNNEFYSFENNGYDRGGMLEIVPAKPANSMPPASQSRPNSQALERTLDPYSSVTTETQEVSVRVDADDPMEENPEGSQQDAATVEEINEDPVKRTSVGVGAFSSLEKQEVSLAFPDEPIPEGSFGEDDTYPPPPSPPIFSPDNQDFDSGEGREHSTGPLGDVYAEVSRRPVPDDPRTETIARSVNFADDTDTMTDDLPDDYPSQFATSDETLTYFP